MVEGYNIYEDISKRTNGEIYVGVVGPVRTGKSTFIKRMMELLVIPNIEDVYERERVRDELPQSATGRTIMTTEPKFVPDKAAHIVMGENIHLKTRLVDCVGYLVDNALGYNEEDVPRMVNTPWFDYQVPFEEAAEIGTRKVIEDHSTIGFLITTDGSVTEFGREDYVDAEEKVVVQLRKFNKPFTIILNTARPESAGTQELKERLEAKYNAPVIAVDCARMNINDVNTVLEKVLYEFPVREISVNFPKWIEALENDYALKADMVNAVKNSFANVSKIRNVTDCINNFSEYEFIKKAQIEEIDLGCGEARIELMVADNLFYEVLSDVTGIEINNEYHLVSTLKNLSNTKKKFDRIEYALNCAKTTGYGIVAPNNSEMELAEPEIIKQGGRFGIRLKASAPSIHMIRADIETEIAPLVGTEKQSEELVNYLLDEFETQPDKIWASNMFGKSLHDLVSEGLQNKLSKMPDDAQGKLQETLQRIINEGSSGLICIIL